MAAIIKSKNSWLHKHKHQTKWKKGHKFGILFGYTNLSRKLQLMIQPSRLKYHEYWTFCYNFTSIRLGITEIWLFDEDGIE